MNNLKKLSIITINLNNALGLRKTIESVINQTSHDFEYIIIDGGSSDSSVQVIQEYKLKITHWLSEPDGGIYNAMNKGIVLAKGEYCQFLNSGDWLVSSEVTSLMLENLPDCNIIYGNMLKKLLNGEIIKNKEIPLNSFLTFYTGALNHSSAYIRRSLFEKYGLYDENLKIVSDWKFYLKAIVLNNEKVCYRDIDLTYFDMSGISSTDHQLDRIEREKVLNEMIPPIIVSDYKRYSEFIVQMKRINRFKLTRCLVWFIERILFKIEKSETHRKGEHILY
jgi:glycosyltransferase involved in cell wall biosynthesis